LRGCPYDICQRKDQLYSIYRIEITDLKSIYITKGTHVYGEGFGYGSAAGTVAGTFEVPPGTVRTIHINIKSEKTGDFTIHFTGLYWPDDDKDERGFSP